MMGRSLDVILLLACSLPTSGGQAPCGQRQPGPTHGEHSVNLQVQGRKRRFVLYVPKNYTAEAPVPLWVLGPGTFNAPEKQLEMSDLRPFAEEQQFAIAALAGLGGLMNVVRHCRPQPGRPDDVAYTKAVLAAVQQRLCIDERRIFCTGYSRGARFCMQLASELSEVFAAVAPVGGIRYPEPNSAKRPMPILAIHGTGDPVNPYKGHGNPEYWYDSVPNATTKWAAFNECAGREASRLASGVREERHTKCAGDADVVLVTVADGGHVWPGSPFPWVKNLGFVTQEIKATELIGQFFREHPMPAEPDRTTPKGKGPVEKPPAGTRSGKPEGTERSATPEAAAHHGAPEGNGTAKMPPKGPRSGEPEGTGRNATPEAAAPHGAPEGKGPAKKPLAGQGSGRPEGTVHNATPEVAVHPGAPEVPRSNATLVAALRARQHPGMNSTLGNLTVDKLLEQKRSEQQQPLAGQQQPLAGQQQPLAGQQLPLAGQQQPLAGQQLPLAGQQLPDDELEPVFAV